MSTQQYPKWIPVHNCSYITYLPELSESLSVSSEPEYIFSIQGISHLTNSSQTDTLSINILEDTSINIQLRLSSSVSGSIRMASITDAKEWVNTLVEFFQGKTASVDLYSAKRNIPVKTQYISYCSECTECILLKRDGLFERTDLSNIPYTIYDQYTPSENIDSGVALYAIFKLDSEQYYINPDMQTVYRYLFDSFGVDVHIDGSGTISNHTYEIVNYTMVITHIQNNADIYESCLFLNPKLASHII